MLLPFTHMLLSICSAFLLLVCCHASALNAAGNALDGDPCIAAEDCLPPRRCLDSSARLHHLATPCCSSSTSCFCTKPRQCVSDDECHQGEHCVLDVGVPLCFSERTIRELNLLPVPLPDVNARPPVYGFTGDLCSNDADCQGSRKCRPQSHPLRHMLSCGPEYVACSCHPDTITLCEKPVDDEWSEGNAVEEANNECPDGEVCQSTQGLAVCFTAKLSLNRIRQEVAKGVPDASVLNCPGTLMDNITETVSAENITKPVLAENMTDPVSEQHLTDTPAESSAEPSVENDAQPVSMENGAEEDEVCIAVKSLTNFKQHELLYSKPRIARVLCDSNESCATPGHIVLYNDELMMMKTYCKLRGCSSKLMYVNSPRFRRGIRVESNTECLSFTALAARYQSGTEERLLSLGVRMGLL
eukprot:TRINITY_DN6490_c0_g1_i1.p2 TRINITY_DN6490_c0_g1~~TRINITY_DN6490_c0_g1_i1.p2  ORF type:complete len:415 (-),score=48.91 TRINITY_DN6490_c0_g1_i1:972-2216(-)